MGVTTEVCVQTSMREANDRGYDSLLLEDCTESYFPAFKAATLEMVRAQGGIVGWTATSAALLPCWRRCRHSPIPHC
jgi:nicotinamidase-related amidase